MDIPQLTLSLIAGMTPPDHEVEICEEVYGNIINYDGDYDLVGITLMTQTSIRGYEIANEFKKREKKVVFGRIHATAYPEEAIMFGDAVVIGDAVPVNTVCERDSGDIACCRCSRRDCGRPALAESGAVSDMELTQSDEGGH